MLTKAAFIWLKTKQKKKKKNSNIEKIILQFKIIIYLFIF